MNEKRLSEVLSDLMNNKGILSGGLRRDGIIDWEKIWAEISGDASKYSYFLKLDKDTIIVSVKNSAWVLELKKREKDLLKAISERTGREIKKIKLVR